MIFIEGIRCDLGKCEEAASQGKPQEWWTVENVPWDKDLDWMAVDATGAQFSTLEV